MQIKAKTPEEYIENIPDNRKEAVRKLRKIILENLAKGFTETIDYGMIGYVVPHSIYQKDITLTQSSHYLLLILHHKKIIFPSIIWVCIVIRIYWAGLPKSIQITQPGNLIWERVA